MKSLFNLWLLCIVLLSACNPENGAVEAIPTNDCIFKTVPLEDQTLENSPIDGQTFILPNNESNSYDFIGNFFLIALQQQLMLDDYEETTTDLVPPASNNSKGSADDLVYSINELWDIIDQPPIPRKALVRFITKVLDQRQMEYMIQDTYTVDFEDQVLNSQVYSLEEQGVILSLSSIIRFVAFHNDISMYAEDQDDQDDQDDHDDDDWDISVGNLLRWLFTVIVDR